MSRSYTKTISVTSGKGGVGKSTMVANLALHLSTQGQKKVLLLDGDLGMANLDIMFGVRSTKNISDVVSGEHFLEEVIVPINSKLSLIPGGSGVYDLQNMSIYQKQSLMEQVNSLSEQYDYMLIDTPPGIADNVLYLNSAAQEILLVLTPDPASLADTYALIKVLHQRHRENKFSVVCNCVRDEYEALKVFKRLSDVTAKFLHVSLDYKGFIPFDVQLRKATKAQQLILQKEPRCPSSFAVKQLAEKLCDYGHINEMKGGMQFFWQQLVGVAS